MEVAGEWVAHASEHLRANSRERERTEFDVSKLPRDPRDGEVVGFVVVGPSRAVTDKPEYHRRTDVTWWRWGPGMMTQVAPGTPPTPKPPGGGDVPVKPEDMRQYTVDPGVDFAIPGADHIIYTAIQLRKTPVGEEDGVAIVITPRGEHREVWGGVHISCPVGTMLRARHQTMIFHGYVNYGA
jgi:hypothetical protein